MNGLRFVASFVVLLLAGLLGLHAQGANIGFNQPPQIHQALNPDMEVLLFSVFVPN